MALCDCAAAPGGIGRCLYVACCPWCAAGDIAEAVGESYATDCCFACCFPIASCFVWASTRYVIRTSPCRSSDVYLSLLSVSLAALQGGCEIKAWHCGTAQIVSIRFTRPGSVMMQRESLTHRTFRCCSRRRAPTCPTASCTVYVLAACCAKPTTSWTVGGACLRTCPRFHTLPGVRTAPFLGQHPTAPTMRLG